MTANRYNRSNRTLLDQVCIQTAEDFGAALFKKRHPARMQDVSVLFLS